MRSSLKTICFTLAISLLFSFSAYADNRADAGASSDENSDENIDIPYFTEGKGGNLHGFWVQSQGNLDYPSIPNCPARQMEEEAQKIIETAVQYGYNSVFYSVTPEAAAMYKSKYLPASRFVAGTQGGISFIDPLKLLVEYGARKHVEVCAVISPFYLGDDSAILDQSSLAVQNPDWTLSLNGNRYYNPARTEVQTLIGNLTTELVSRYRLSGVAVDFSGYPDFIATDEYYHSLRLILQNCFRNIKKQLYDAELGVILDGNLSMNPIGADFVSQLTQNHVVDFILPQMDFTVTGKNLYAQALEKWQTLAEDTRTQVFTVNHAQKLLSPSTDGLFFGDVLELNSQQYVNQTLKVNGSVIQSYRNLMLSPYPLAQDLASTATVNQNLVRTLDFTPTSRFMISHPSSVVSTELSSYYVSGVCDPQLPLTLNEKPISEISDWGRFGILLPLTPGVNSFNFTQAAITKTVSIIRQSANSSKLGDKINSIAESSAYPKQDDAVLIQNPFSLQCIAPAGGTVSARFLDQIYPLVQANPKAKEGQAVLYTALLDLSSLGGEGAFDGAPVTYTLSYNGKTMVQASEGKLTLIANDKQFAVRVSDAFTPLYQDPAGTIVENILQLDSYDYVKSGTKEFFELQSGGFIAKSAVQVLTDPTEINSLQKEIKNVVVQSIPKGEYITLAGGAGLPAKLQYDQHEGTLSLTLNNVISIPQNLRHLKSELFQSITVKQEENTAVVILLLREDQELFGYHTVFNEGNLILYCKSRFLPKEQQRNNSTPDSQANPDQRLRPQPLSGLNVVIDPGHGGKNSNHNNSTEVSGFFDTNEDDLNLAASLALANRLQAYGASVTLTRTNDSPISDMDRIMLSKYQDADLFFSIHHDYSKDNQDALLFSGVSVANNQSFSKAFAQDLANQLAYRLHRKNNGVIEDNPYITQISMAPALQINLGYLSNPEEYVHLLDSLELYRSACIITQTVLNFLSQSEGVS